MKYECKVVERVKKRGSTKMAEKFEETAIIIRQEEIADDIYSMWLHTDQIAVHAKAGQFVSVYCNDGSRLLPRPIRSCIVTTARFAELIHAPHIIPQL